MYKCIKNNTVIYQIVFHILVLLNLTPPSTKAYTVVYVLHYLSVQAYHVDDLYGCLLVLVRVLRLLNVFIAIVILSLSHT